jgi:hypothetical protein
MHSAAGFRRLSPKIDEVAHGLDDRLAALIADLSR